MTSSYIFISLVCRIWYLKKFNILCRSYDALRGSPVLLKLIKAVAIIAFAVWGLGPLIRLGRIIFFQVQNFLFFYPRCLQTEVGYILELINSSCNFVQRSDSSWKKSRSHYAMTSYLRPLLLWGGAILVCRYFSLLQEIRFKCLSE